MCAFVCTCICAYVCMCICGFFFGGEGVSNETRKRTMMKKKSSEWRWDRERIIEHAWYECRLGD